jgi:hypothetical protein
VIRFRARKQVPVGPAFGFFEDDQAAFGDRLEQLGVRPDGAGRRRRA